MGRAKATLTKSDLDTVGADDVKTELMSPMVPNYTSFEWHDYVMSMFEAEELDINGYPKLTGLRRVANDIFLITHSQVNIVDFPNANNGNRATAIYTLVASMRSDINPQTIQLGDAADACPSNCPNLVANYPVAMASARAEGRALRKLLLLRTLASEELAESENTNQVKEKEGYIKIGQTYVIETLCKRNDLNLMKFINDVSFLIDAKPYNKIEEVTYDKAIAMIAALRKIQNQTNDKPVPNDMKGFDPKWRN